MATAILIVTIACAAGFVWLAIDLHKARKRDNASDDFTDATSEAEYICGTCGHHWDVHRGDHMPTFCTAPGCSCEMWTRPQLDPNNPALKE